MDYVEIIENYVKQAWEQGEATADIKAQLIAKRWPEEMITAVIDRLVKHRVETNEGKIPEINGPDLWSQPTWTTDNIGWNAPPVTRQHIDTKVVKNGKSSSLSQISLPQKPHKRRFSALIAANSSTNQTTSTQISSSVVDSMATAPVLGAQSTTTQTATNKPELSTSSPNIQETSPIQTAVSQPVNPIQTNPQTSSSGVLPNKSESTIIETQKSESSLAINPNLPKTTAEIIASLQARDNQQKKLPQKLQESRIARSEDEKIQIRSLIFLAFLFFVLVLALLWRFFVVQ